MPTATRSNHFSPQFSNRYWAASSGTIKRLYLSRSGEIRTGNTSAKAWGCEDNLYSQEVEDAFGRIEARVAPIYAKLVANVVLGPVDRLTWSHWILCQFARTPTLMLELAGFGEDVFRMVDFECDFSWDEIGGNLRGLESHGLEFPSSMELIAFIALRDWLLLRPAEGEFFIKGDVPVVIRGALIEDNAKIVYPLTPELCFMATVLGSFPPTQVQTDGRLNPGGTLRFNQLIASAAEREVICQPDHFGTELQKVVGEHLGKNVRFVNHSNLPSW